MSLFYPTILRKRVTSITAEDLRALGVRGLLLDVDNTLTTHGSQALDPAVLAWLRAMEAAGFTPTVVSNALRQAGGAFRRQAGGCDLSPLPASRCPSGSCGRPSGWGCPAGSAWLSAIRPSPTFWARGWPASPASRCCPFNWRSISR